MLDLWGGYFCTLSSEADCECPLYRLIQKFEKTVVVFKKSLYNRVVAFVTALVYYKEMVTIQHHLDEAEPLQENGEF